METEPKITMTTYIHKVILFVLLSICMSSCNRMNLSTGVWSVAQNGCLVQTGLWSYVYTGESSFDVQQYPDCYVRDSAVIGVSNGVFSSYFNDSKLAHVCVISNGYIQGIWQMWYPNGQRSLYGRVEDGNMIGLWIWWDMSGAVSEAAYVHPDGKEEYINLRSGEDVQIRTRSGPHL